MSIRTIKNSNGTMTLITIAGITFGWASTTGLHGIGCGGWKAYRKIKNAFFTEE